MHTVGYSPVKSQVVKTAPAPTEALPTIKLYNFDAIICNLKILNIYLTKSKTFLLTM